MRVLFLTAEGFDTPNSINHLVTSLCEDILKAGHELHVVSSHKTGIYQDVPDALLKYPKLTTDVIYRKPIDKNRFVFRYVDEIRFAFRAFRQWRKQKRQVDVIVLQSNSNAVFHAMLLRFVLRVPIVLNMYDVFPGHAYDIGVIKSKVVFKALLLLQKILYSQCATIVAMSSDMKDKLIADGVPPDKTVVINNWFDDEIFQVIPRDQNRFFAKYDLPVDKFYVQFAGLLGYVFDYEMFVDTANLLKDETEIVFLLIGDGNQREKVEAYIKSSVATNIRVFPWQPLELIADVYSACDVGIIPLKEGVIGNGFPSKACQLMASSRVVLNVMEKSDYSDMFEEYDMGVSVSSGRPADVAECIRMLYRDISLRKRMGENAQQYSRQHFARSTNTRLFIELLDTLTEWKRK